MATSIEAEVKRLHAAGYDLLALNGKKPVGANWVKRPRTEVDELIKQVSRGKNVGIRLGRQLSDERYIACIDVDIVGKLTESEERELAVLMDTLVGGSSPPIAVTGFGNASQHVYVATAAPAKTESLGKASRKVEYTKAGKTKKGPVWTVELRGYGAQTVLPPSVHPDTQATYKWQDGSKLNGADGLPDLALQPVSSGKSKAAGQGNRTPTGANSHPYGDGASIGASVQGERHERALAAIAPVYRRLLQSGEQGEYESRSEALYAVLGVIVRDTDLNDDEIEAFVIQHPLGAKAVDKPQGWVAGQASKLRDRMPSGEGGVIAQVELLPEGATLDQLKPIIKRAALSGLSPIELDRFIDVTNVRHGLSKRALALELKSARADGVEQRAKRLDTVSDDPVYKEIFERHALVSWAGKPAIFRERFNPPPWESRYDIMTLASLAAFYENKPVLVGKKAVNPAEVWRSDPSRREFLEGARLIPPDEECPEGVFNLWQGFACEQKRGSVNVWRDFLLEVVCSGHAGYLNWLEDWIADLFQNPGHPQGVAIVMRGEEGIGKGTFANVLGHLLGGHYRHVTQESQLTGRFNGHFADSALIFADELVWGGDKKHRGTLYALVTEKYLMVERKNFDAVPMRNLNRMIIASNNDWVVPTGMDGRRWFVLDVSNKHKGDTAYFGKIRRFLKGNHGYPAILDYYMRRKISNDLRRAPVTKALIDQKMAGFDSVASWWTAVLERGCIRPPIGDATSAWDAQVSKELLSNSYRTFCGDYGVKPVYHGIMMKGLHKLVPSIEETRPREGEKRVQLVTFPDLKACQKHFQKLLNGGAS